MVATRTGKTDEAERIQLTPIQLLTMTAVVEGKSPLIVNRFDEKAKTQMLENQVKTRTKAKRPPQDPEAEYESSKYRLPDGREGFPAVAFKAAMVGAARYFDGVTMTSLKQSIVVQGEGPGQLVPIVGESHMREDVTRANGSTHLRYRAAYSPWSVLLTISFVETVIDQGSVLALLDAAGLGGVGEWRPSAPKSYTGSYGQFEVSRTADAIVAV